MHYLCYNAGMGNNQLLTSAPGVKDVKRDSNGRWLERPAGHTITHADASILARKRWDKYRQASARGIMREAIAIDPTVQTPADAYALVVGKQYLALMDSDRPKMDDVYRLGQIIGALPTAHDRVQAEAATVSDITGVVSALTSFIRQVRGQPLDIITVIPNEAGTAGEADEEREEG